MTKSGETVGSRRKAAGSPAASNSTRQSKIGATTTNSGRAVSTSISSGGRKSDGVEVYVNTLPREVNAYQVLEDELKFLERGISSSLWSAGGGGCVAFGLDLLKDFVKDWDWRLESLDVKSVVWLVAAIISFSVGVVIVVSKWHELKKVGNLCDKIRRSSGKKRE
jgi:hypothetical protein